MKTLVADDGLRNTDRHKHGTNHRYPCGHPRTAENTRTTSSWTCCLLCRRRLERESSDRRKALAAKPESTQRISIRNTSGHTGVYKRDRTGRAVRWVAVIGLNNRVLHIGNFKTLEEAIAARKQAELAQ